MTPQRELIFRSFFELGRHVSVDELYERVRKIDHAVGYSTVWRNLKLMCDVGLATEVNLGDGITRYNRLTRTPHGHLYCLSCKQLLEFELDAILPLLEPIAAKEGFGTDSYKVEVRGYCTSCKQRLATDNAAFLEARPKLIRRHVQHD